MLKNISNLGDAALYCDFGNEINKETNSHVIKYFKNLQKLNLKGITNITPSYNKLIISFDLRLTNYNEIKKKILSLDIKEEQKTNSKKLERRMFRLTKKALLQNLSSSTPCRCTFSDFLFDHSHSQ